MNKIVEKFVGKTVGKDLKSLWEKLWEKLNIIYYPHIIWFLIKVLSKFSRLFSTIKLKILLLYRRVLHIMHIDYYYYN